MEIWKDIKGFEGFYQVSNLGRIRSLPRKGKGRWGIKDYSGIVLKPVLSDRGYLKLRLYKNGGKTFRVHRLVAEAFLPNPQNLPEVNHINENKQDNRVENLEWADRKANCQYGSRTKKIASQLSRPVIQMSLGGEILETFASSREVERKLNFSASHINECCNGKRKTSNGYKWEYA